LRAATITIARDGKQKADIGERNKDDDPTLQHAGSSIRYASLPAPKIAGKQGI
jgi:hypothetical protein